MILCEFMPEILAGLSHKETAPLLCLGTKRCAPERPQVQGCDRLASGNEAGEGGKKGGRFGH